MIERFRHYVLVDHKARWRNDTLCMAISIVWYLVSVGVGVPNASAFKVSVGFLITTVVISTFWRSITTREHDLTSALEIDFSKRALLPRLAMAAAFVLVSIGFGTPALEAAIIDKRLRRVLEGDPTPDKLGKAAQIATEAQENNLRASPELITRLGEKILDSSAKPQLRDSAVAAASAFASYRSNLSPVPQGQASIPAGGSVTIKISCLSPLSKPFTLAMKEMEEQDTTSPDTPIVSGIGGRYRLECQGCSRIMIQPTDRQAGLLLLPLRNMHARNAVFVDGTFPYDGGPLKLESVQFLRSNFQIPVVDAGSPNVQRFLAAVMTGQPVNLDL
jgi:hypothetical protein